MQLGISCLDNRGTAYGPSVTYKITCLGSRFLIMNISANSKPKAERLERQCKGSMRNQFLQKTPENPPHCHVPLRRCLKVHRQCAVPQCLSEVLCCSTQVRRCHAVPISKVLYCSTQVRRCHAVPISKVLCCSTQVRRCHEVPISKVLCCSPQLRRCHAVPISKVLYCSTQVRRCHAVPLSKVLCCSTQVKRCHAISKVLYCSTQVRRCHAVPISKVLCCSTQVKRCHAVPLSKVLCCSTQVRRCPAAAVLCCSALVRRCHAVPITISKVLCCSTQVRRCPAAAVLCCSALVRRCLASGRKIRHCFAAAIQVIAPCSPSPALGQSLPSSKSTLQILFSSYPIQPSVPEIMSSKFPLRRVNRRAGGESQNQGYPWPFIVVLNFLLIVQYSENHYWKLLLDSGSSVPFQFDCVHIWRHSEIICLTKVAYCKCLVKSDPYACLSQAF